MHDVECLKLGSHPEKSMDFTHKYTFLCGYLITSTAIVHLSLTLDE